MEPDIEAKLERLDELADNLVSGDRFVRLTAYSIFTVLMSELEEFAKSHQYPHTNIANVLTSMRSHAGALAGTTFYDLPDSEHQSFYLKELSKLKMRTCFGKD